ncbi:hypothetical protein D3C76_1380430 [compost metagenome]
MTPWREQPLFASIPSARHCARVFINRRHQLEWPGGCVLAAQEVYHLIKPVDERNLH